MDPPDEGTPPKFAIANVSIYTSMLKAGLPIAVDNMPEQWKRKKPASESGTYQQQSGGRSNRGDFGKHRGDDPFWPDETAENLVNPSPPKSFRRQCRVTKVDEATNKTVAPVQAMAELGKVLPRLIYAVANAPDGQGPILFSKLDIKDGYWRMVVPEDEEWQFAYVLPKEFPDDDTFLVVPSSL